MRNYPYQRLIRYLHSIKADPTPALQTLRLPYPDWRDSLEIKNKLLFGPQPPIVGAWFRGSATPVANSDAFMTWAASHGIHELWEHRLGTSSPDFKAAATVFENPAIRTVVSLLLVAGFDPVEVQEILYKKYRFSISVTGITQFQSVFWDPSVMSRKDWTDLVNEMDKDQRSIFVLAFSELGKDGIKLSLGIVPEIDLGAILGDVAATAFGRYRDELENAMPDEDKAMKWAKVAIAAAEKKKRFGGGPSRSLGEEIQLQLQHETNKIPTLAELTASDKAAKPKNP